MQQFVSSVSDLFLAVLVLFLMLFIMCYDLT